MNRLPAPPRILPARLAVFLLAGLALSLTGPAPLRAAPAAAPAGIEAKNPWVRWLPGNLPGAGYMILVNRSAEDAFLTGASSDDYGHLELHESYTTADGDARMRMVRMLRVPAHGEATLAPGGYHFMLFNPRHAIQPGATVVIQLAFKDGPPLVVHLPVKPAGAQP